MCAQSRIHQVQAHSKNERLPPDLRQLPRRVGSDGRSGYGKYKTERRHVLDTDCDRDPQ